MENRRAEIEACIGRCDTGDGVVLLTDMFGGTPCNLAISMMERKGVEVIAGVNLPMLVKLAKVRSKQPLADAVTCAEDAGRKYIAAASHVLHGCKVNGLPSPAPTTTPKPPAGPPSDRRAVRRACPFPHRHDLQQARPACPGRGAVRHPGGAVRRLGRRVEGRTGDFRPLHHGPDDAGRRRGVPISSCVPKAGMPRRRWTPWQPWSRQASMNRIEPPPPQHERLARPALAVPRLATGAEVRTA